MIKKSFAGSLAAVLLGLCFSAYAQDAAKAPAPVGKDAQINRERPRIDAEGRPDFGQFKQFALTRVGKHIANAQALQSCMQAANDHDAMRSCHDQMRTAEMADAGVHPDFKRGPDEGAAVRPGAAVGAASGGSAPGGGRDGRLGRRHP